MEDGLSQGMIILFMVIAFIFNEMGKRSKEEEILRDQRPRKDYKEEIERSIKAFKLKKEKKIK